MDKLVSRRNFVKGTVAAAAASSLYTMANAAHHGSGTVKVALIGCGGRSNRDLPNFIKACEILGKKAKVVGLADAFQDRLDTAAEKYGVDKKHCFVGFQAYQQVLETDAEFVILATPPNFRPKHLEAVIKSGKHAMIEKPVAVDAPGCRRIIELGEQANKKGLAIVAGVQRRYDIAWLTNKAQIDAGAIGTILGGTVSWNGTVPWIWGREQKWDDREYLTRNWLNWSSMSGDHIVEQHVHNLDVANWFLGRTPKSCVGFGGRARRQTGDQYDFFSLDLDYGDGVHIHSQCRQLSGCFNRVGEFFRGTEGEAFGNGKIKGKDVKIPEIVVDSDNGSVQEMVNLIRGVYQDKPLNDARSIAESTATAIMGRLSAYTGKLVQWSDLMQNPNSEFYNLSIGSTAEDFENGTVVMPMENIVPVPGDGIAVRRKYS
ncbi:MAG: Gfo/Idh/MocA family oxidoreductase [Cyanothece sp. SIO1E1]|nr:Gfo/Idh/MocA family oxidoreductase [Cyanothece sp. SIO1E1]